MASLAGLGHGCRLGKGSDEAEPKTPEAEVQWTPPKDLPPCYGKLKVFKEKTGLQKERLQCNVLALPMKKIRTAGGVTWQHYCQREL